jgi:hypothetical protein
VYPIPLGLSTRPLVLPCSLSAADALPQGHGTCIVLPR